MHFDHRHDNAFCTAQCADRLTLGVLKRTAMIPALMKDWLPCPICNQHHHIAPLHHPTVLPSAVVLPLMSFVTIIIRGNGSIETFTRCIPTNRWKRQAVVIPLNPLSISAGNPIGIMVPMHSCLVIVCQSSPCRCTQWGSVTVHHSIDSHVPGKIEHKTILRYLC